MYMDPGGMMHQGGAGMPDNVMGYPNVNYMRYDGMPIVSPVMMMPPMMGPGFVAQPQGMGMMHAPQMVPVQVMQPGYAPPPPPQQQQQQLQQPAVAATPVNPVNASKTNLFVRNLHRSINDTILLGMFSQYGPIVSSVVMRNILTGESLGNGFVRFENHIDAQNALNALNDTLHAGNTIMHVQWAKKQHDTSLSEDTKRSVKKLFVRNVPVDITHTELLNIFQQFGPLKKIVIQRDTASSNLASVARAVDHEVLPILSSIERHIAFIIYSEEGCAVRAAEAIHNTMPFPSCNGIAIMAKLAEDTQQRKSRRAAATGKNTKGKNRNQKSQVVTSGHTESSEKDSSSDEHAHGASNTEDIPESQIFNEKSSGSANWPQPPEPLGSMPIVTDVLRATPITDTHERLNPVDDEKVVGSQRPKAPGPIDCMSDRVVVKQVDDSMAMAFNSRKSSSAEQSARIDEATTPSSLRPSALSRAASDANPLTASPITHTNSVGGTSSTTTTTTYANRNSRRVMTTLNSNSAEPSSLFGAVPIVKVHSIPREYSAHKDGSMEMHSGEIRAPLLKPEVIKRTFSYKCTVVPSTATNDESGAPLTPLAIRRIIRTQSGSVASSGQPITPTWSIRSGNLETPLTSTSIRPTRSFGSAASNLQSCFRQFGLTSINHTRSLDRVSLGSLNLGASYSGNVSGLGDEAMLVSYDDMLGSQFRSSTATQVTRTVSLPVRGSNSRNAGTPFDDADNSIRSTPKGYRHNPYNLDSSRDDLF